tara:strand:+ start:25 stop:375 length:351 start_codon:yes stop_codon:yes gene_type:complete
VLGSYGERGGRGMNFKPNKKKVILSIIIGYFGTLIFGTLAVCLSFGCSLSLSSLSWLFWPITSFVKYFITLSKIRELSELSGGDDLLPMMWVLILSVVVYVIWSLIQQKEVGVAGK